MTSQSRYTGHLSVAYIWTVISCCLFVASQTCLMFMSALLIAYTLSFSLEIVK